MIFKFKIFFVLFLNSFLLSAATLKYHTLTGKIVDSKTSEALSYATVSIPDVDVSTMTDDKGDFSIPNIREGLITLEIHLLGYAPVTLNLDIRTDTIVGKIALKESNLSLPTLEVTAQGKQGESTTSYVMDRSVLDHAQVLNLSDVMSLLPGNQTFNSTLMNDSRIALRAGSSEQGNASFGTAIEVDGVRQDNNANMDETLAASTRNLSSSNIGKVEIITGIPGVEYGDLSNGMVKVTPRRGQSPWIVEASINPYTRQIAVNKGLELGVKGGVLNLSVEYARSFSTIASPYTSYKRWILSGYYSNNFIYKESTFTLNAGLSVNTGGYKSCSDPDAFVDTYQKINDNKFQANVRFDWLYNKAGKGVFKTSLNAALIYSDLRSESYTNTSSSSTQAYLHTVDEGYHIAQDYDDTKGIGDIIIGPTGYWYVRKYNDQKPVSLQIKLKTEWTQHFSCVVNRVMLGLDYQLSCNNGRGVYYENMAVAPTWRPYVYSDLPSLNILGFFVEDRFHWNNWTLTAGLRNDITAVPNSDYGTVSSFSPRVNIRYALFENASSNLNMYGSYGKGVKLPSFQVLYPADGYTDRLIFTPGSTSDNKAYYAYYTHVSKTMHNTELRWQSSQQVDIGMEATFEGIKFTLSGYLNRTANPYQMVNIYTPFAYNYTSQTALENCGIPSEHRQYNVDRNTGIVTVTSSVDGSSITLPSTRYKTYVTNRKFVNGSPVTRCGLEWIVNFPLTRRLSLVGVSLRLDGNFYFYKGLNNVLFAGAPNSGVGDHSEESGISPLIGYYSGSNVTSTANVTTPSVSNGSLSKGCTLNTTFTVRVPKLRLIMTVRFETTFLNYKRQLATNNAILLKAAGDVFGKPFNGEKDSYVAVYPEYFSTWENPSERLPFIENLMWAQQNDKDLYNRLTALIVRSNTSYYFNPQDISAYFSANFSITKEIGKWISLSFYANNFFNNMSFVRNAQTGLETSLFGSTFIPKFYYGLSVRVKI